jgi:excisionase family DNA binding protein
MIGEDFGRAFASLLDIPSAVRAMQVEIAALRSEVAALRKALPPVLVPVPEAARLLGVSESTLWRRIKDGTLPVQRIGSAVRVDLSSLRAADAAEVARLAAEARTAPTGT